ncbi:MAG TPA: carboxypeptidase-like regulatory domain-containing protein [Planctomycetota bacterium]|jgi:protocatechuate 3,4-dioxygenase beta subunit|nr:carboxypeptidase-like regulatory domain-containing protein [Planctomycetota bacterium]
MRPIHLGLAALLLAAALAALWVSLDLSPWIAHAGAGRDAPTALANASLELAAGAADAQTPAQDAAATRVALAPAEDPVAAAVERKAPELPHVTGRIVDPKGAGIAGATVFAASGTSWIQIPLDVEPEALPRGWIRVERTTTDAEGRFEFATLKPGPLRVAARAAGFAPRYEDRLDLPDRPDCALPDLAMEPGVVLSGRVVDADGKAVEGATLLSALAGAASGSTKVTLPGRGIPLATSDAEGAFRVDQLASGPWKLIIDAPGQAISEEEGRTERAGEHQSGLVFRVERGFEVLGRVRAEFGTLPEGLRIGARPSPERENGPRGPASEAEDVPGASDTRARFATCTADGSFVVRGVKSGVRYSLTLSKASDEPGGWKRIRATDPVFAWAGQRGLEILYRPESALVFRVLDGRTGAPLTSFGVWAGVGREQPLRDEKNQAVHEFKDGRVRFGELRPKRGGPAVLLRVAANGFKDLERKDVALDPAQELDLGDLTLEASPLVLARVLDDRTGTPVDGARVIVGTKSDQDVLQRLDRTQDTDLWGQSDIRYARTDAKGLARLSSLPGKAAIACACAKGFLASEPLHVTLPADRDQEIELRLKHGGTIVVRVRDTRGQPVEGVALEHKQPARDPEDEDSAIDSRSLKTDSAGLVQFDALAPGTHAFRVSDRPQDGVWFDEQNDAHQEAWVESVVAEGSQATLEFSAPARGGLFGVVREGGRPLEGAQLHLEEIRAGGEHTRGWFSPGTNDPSTTISDADGRYRYEGLRCGSYRLQVAHGSRRMAAVFDVAIESPARPFDVDLDVASIEGRVTGEDGEALPGIDVQAMSVQRDDGGVGSWRMVVTEDDRGLPRVDYRQESRPNAKTDAAGRFVLRGVRTGEPLVVTASGEKVVSGRVEGITVGPDEARRGVDFVLKAAGVIEVTLAGNPQRLRGQQGWYQLRAFRIGEDGKQDLAQTNYLGGWNPVCRMRSLRPGKYKVAINAGGDESAAILSEQEVEVVAGQVSKVVLDPR